MKEDELERLRRVTKLMRATRSPAAVPKRILSFRTVMVVLLTAVIIVLAVVGKRENDRLEEAKAKAEFAGHVLKKYQADTYGSRYDADRWRRSQEIAERGR